MCGRYQFDLGNDLRSKSLKEKIKKKKIEYKEGEIFPGDKVLCIFLENGQLKLTSMRWGIKKEKMQINARVESLDKPFYDGMRERRCVLPANGFYEWDLQKDKYYVSFDEPFVYLAAICNENKELLVLTREADDDFRHIHDRFPLILDKNGMNDYLEGRGYSCIRTPMSIENQG